MTCRELIEFLWRYLEDELPAAERRAFDEHLAVCPDCVDYLASYRETIRLAQDAYADPSAEVPDDVPEELVQAILDVRTSRRDR
jgi:anti-sigma factor RsiW